MIKLVRIKKAGKYGAAVFVLLALLIPLSQMQPQEARAQAGCAAGAAAGAAATGGLIAVGSAAGGFPVSDAGAKIIAAKTSADISVQNTVLCILDGLAWTVAKTAVNSLTQSVVNWINSGFEGSPAFVTDLNRNLGNLADAVAEDFIRGLNRVAQNNTGISIRAPFQDQIARELREEFYRTTSSYGFDIRNPYTLGNYSSNPQAFTQGDFSRGGFSAYFALTQNNANNPYGRYQLARNELFSQLDQEAQTRIQELTWGNGFLSWRGPCGPNANKNPALEGRGKQVNLSQSERNRGCSIRTPGAVIESTLGIAVTSPFRQLELADNINEIVGALLSQMVNQVLGGTGLSGVSQPSAGGGRSFIDQATDPTASLSGGFAQNIADTRRKITGYQSNWQRIATAATNARQACSGDQRRSEEAEIVLEVANGNLRNATTALAALASIDAERTRLTSAGTNNSNAANDLIKRFVDVLSGTGALTEGEIEALNTGDAEPGSLYSQMVRLAAECS